MERIPKQTLTIQNEYDLKDQLGNVRVVFTKNKTTGVAQKLQETHYYAFGLQMNGLGSSGNNKYLYNGKEKQEQTGWYNYGFRQLDAVLGRWHVIDAMAESFASMSPYVYGLDNPVNVVDIDGLWTNAAQSNRGYDTFYCDGHSFTDSDGMFHYGGKGYSINNSPVPTGGSNNHNTGPNYNDYLDHKNSGSNGTLAEYWNQMRGLAMKNGYGSVEQMMENGSIKFGKRQVLYKLYVAHYIFSNVLLTFSF